MKPSRVGRTAVERISKCFQLQFHQSVFSSTPKSPNNVQLFIHFDTFNHILIFTLQNFYVLCNRFSLWAGPVVPSRIAPAHGFSVFRHTFSFTPADHLTARFRTQFVPLSHISTGSGRDLLLAQGRTRRSNNVQGRTEQLDTRVQMYCRSRSHGCVYKKKKKIATLFILCISSLSSSSVGKDVNVLVASTQLKIFFYKYIYTYRALPKGLLFFFFSSIKTNVQPTEQRPGQEVRRRNSFDLNFLYLEC